MNYSIVRMRTLVIALATCGLLVACVIAGSKTQPKRSPGTDAIKRLIAGDSKERLAARKELAAQRQEIIKALIRVVGTPTPKDKVGRGGNAALSPQDIMASFYPPKQLAIKLLGKYRAVEAVGLLIDNITHLGSSIGFEYEPAAMYPCVGSLAEIGVPSLEGIISRLKDPYGELEMKLFATVFRLVDGEDMATLRAELALKKATGQRKKSLEQLVELLKAKKWYF